jgi:hypothetical protein
MLLERTITGTSTCGQALSRNCCQTASIVTLILGVAGVFTLYLAIYWLYYDGLWELLVDSRADSRFWLRFVPPSAALWDSRSQPRPQLPLSRYAQWFRAIVEIYAVFCMFTRLNGRNAVTVGGYWRVGMLRLVVCPVRGQEGVASAPSHPLSRYSSTLHVFVPASWLGIEPSGLQRAYRHILSGAGELVEPRVDDNARLQLIFQYYCRFGRTGPKGDDQKTLGTCRP